MNNSLEDTYTLQSAVLHDEDRNGVGEGRMRILMTRRWVRRFNLITRCAVFDLKGQFGRVFALMRPTLDEGGCSVELQQDVRSAAQLVHARLRVVFI